MTALIDRTINLYLRLTDGRDWLKKETVLSPSVDPQHVDELDEKIEAGGQRLNEEYRKGYIQPLRNSLKSRAGKFFTLKWPNMNRAIVVNAAIEPGSQNGIEDDLHRFQAVVSDIYNSFLYSRRREEIGLPLEEKLPPLVAFTSPTTNEEAIPYTIHVDLIRQLSPKFSAGAVSLPSGYRTHPIFWGTLAHEVGGHDVLHADSELMRDLKKEVGNLFTDRQDRDFRLLWMHWCEEAASDVCGVLNIGPSYGLLSMTWLTVMTRLNTDDKVQSLISETNLPLLSNQAFGWPTAPNPGNPLSRYTFLGGGNGVVVDAHPVFALIPYVAIGAVSKLNRLMQATKDRYLAQLKELAQACVGAPKDIQFFNQKFSNLSVPVPPDNRKLHPLPASLPFKKMQNSARKVGELIASVMLKALKDHTLQDLETWDDEDEDVAQLVARKLQNGQSVVGIVEDDNPDIFDDARLIAGAFLAVLRKPRFYNRINRALSDALDYSYKHDRILNRNSASHWNHDKKRMHEDGEKRQPRAHKGNIKVV